MQPLDPSMIRETVIRGVLAELDATALELGMYPVVLKGASLAFTEYQDPSQRPFTDIDIYLEPARAREFANALVKAGYEPVNPPPWRAMFHYTVKGPMTVEVHFLLSTLVDPGTDDRTFLDPEPFPGYRALLMPSPQAHAAYVVLHAHTHGFAHPHWMNDLDVLMRNHAEIKNFWRLLPTRVKIPARLFHSTGIVPGYTLGRTIRAADMAIASFGSFLHTVRSRITI